MTKFLKKFYARGLLTLVSTLVAHIFSLPAVAGDESNMLGYVLFEVDGNLKAVSGGGSLFVVHGDQVNVRHAVDKVGDLVAFLGFGQSRNFAGFDSDLREDPLDTARLSQVAAGKDDLYVFAANQQRRVIGKIHLRVVAPEIFYVLLRVNENFRVARPDRLFTLDESDEFSIEKIVSNVTSEKSPITMELYPLHLQDSQITHRRFDMMFFRGRSLVARVPLKIDQK